MALAKHHYRAIVDGMVKRRARQHQSIHMRDCYAQRDAALHWLKHAAERRAMQIELVPHPRIESWDDIRLLALSKADMAEKAGIKNGVNHFGIIDATFRVALDRCTCCALHG